MRNEIFFLKNFLSLTGSSDLFSLFFFFFSFTGTSAFRALALGSASTGRGLSVTFGFGLLSLAFSTLGASVSGGGFTGSFIIFAGISFFFLGFAFFATGFFLSFDTTAFSGFFIFFLAMAGSSSPAGTSICSAASFSAASFFLATFWGTFAFLAVSVSSSAAFFFFCGCFFTASAFSGCISGSATASALTGSSFKGLRRLRIIVGLIRVSSTSLITSASTPSSAPRITFLILATALPSRALIWLFTGISRSCIFSSNVLFVMLRSLASSYILIFAINPP